MFCLKPLRKIVGVPPDILPGEKILCKWRVSADFQVIPPKNFLTRKSGVKVAF